MVEFEIMATQTPGIVTFDNFDELKNGLQQYIKENFDGVNYEEQGIKVAEADRDELKKRRDIIAKAKKELKEAYSAPYNEVEKKLDELATILEQPFKRAKEYVDEAEKNEKKQLVMTYAKEKAESLGAAGERIINSPAFFNPKWLNKTYRIKNCQDDIDAIITAASRDLSSIQSSGGENVSILTARYYETLSMEGVKSFLETLVSDSVLDDVASVASEKMHLDIKFSR